MPGLIRGVARTAAVVGTATAVSNRVSRRQAGRWADQDQQAYQQQAANEQPPPPAYAQPVPVYAQQPPAYAQPVPVDGMLAAPAAEAAPSPDAMTDKLAQLKQLGELKEQGILSDQEFQAEKAKILGDLISRPGLKLVQNCVFASALGPVSLDESQGLICMDLVSVGR